MKNHHLTFIMGAAGPAVCNNKEFMLAAIKKDVGSYSYASDDLKRDK